MSTTVYSWTGTIEDGYNATAPTITTGDSRYIGTEFDMTGGTEAAGITFQVHGLAAKTDLIVEDTVSAAEIAAGSYVSPEAKDNGRQLFAWVAKCDTGAATAIGTWRHSFRIGDRPEPVVYVTLATAANPSDA